MMKIEYLEDGSEDCPLIRLFGFEESDVAALRDACLALAAGRIAEFRLDGQSWVESIGECPFILRATEKNRGAKWGKYTADPYTMDYNSEGWLEVADKTQPFLTNRAGGFQWLTNEGDFNVLLSWDGCW